MIHTHHYDALVVGAGGAGMMAAIYLSRNPDLKTACISKLYPTRSHTGAAQGGIGAALANLEEDHPEWHAFDTVKGSDYLGDQDAIETMCTEAVDVIVELEHMGLPFSRTPDGKIAQRPFGGHTHHFGEGPVRRSCYAADRTGHMILQTLYQNCIKNGVDFYDEFQVVDVMVEGGVCRGVVAWHVHTGDLHVFHAKATLFATGGFGRVWSITSNAHANTGDGPAIALRAGIPLEDMEFYQFHPTGIYRLGILITEGVRGEGGILRNDHGERFMERYAPTMKDLASRDVVARAISQEIKEGRGINGKKYVYLDATHLGADVIENKLPDIADFCRTYLGIDPVKEPMPIQPTAHYAMGGIPTDIDTQVILDAHGTVLTGMYAAGEVACVSVHGANRLGTNSLLDLVVFGRRAGLAMERFCRTAEMPGIPADPTARTEARFGALLATESGGEPAARLREEMQDVMQDNVGIFRTAAGMQHALDKVRELKARFAKVQVMDRGKRFNTDLLEAWELGNLLDLAEVTTVCALNRTESRGAHMRDDFDKRNDVEWLKHSLAHVEDGGPIRIDYKPVSITRFQPKERVY
ncbi:MAG: succinate dehydrogenase or fumarate reductase, flavoprotein subunit [Gemmatimonadetes bacterium]|nr:succinate dehydrogenase or fumarate reductase, flavoprotein subunit [Gemmatimonadota bacterium]